MAIAIDGADARPRLPAPPRLPVIDVARGVAIAGMVVYHTAFDLYANRLIATDVIGSLPWKMLARSVAGTFLLLVGVGLVLSARGGLNWGRYGRRLAFIAGGALLVSAATYWFDPATFVFFGILHEIAVASLLALPFLLWAPAWLTAGAAAVFLVLPWFWAGDVFNAWPLWWVGLSTDPPVTVDYVPVFPWFGVVLAGLLAGRLVVANQATLARWQPRSALARFVALAGRWSLVIYLVHQPLIVGAVSLLAVVVPPGKETRYRIFMDQCLVARPLGCAGDESCRPLCGCAFQPLDDGGFLNAGAKRTDETDAAVIGILARCQAQPLSPVPDGQ